MPYDATENDEQPAGGMDVLSGEQDVATQEQPMAEPQQLATESATVTSEAPQRVEGPSKTASSGMFTNLKKYVDANKPKTKSMAGAVVKDVSGQADKIKQAVAKRTAETTGSEAFKAEQSRLAGGQQAAQSALQKAQAGQQLSQEEIAGFQSLQKGTGAYQQFQAPDLSQEKLQAQRLEGLGKEITSAEGSDQAIQKTFGKDIKDYTAGERNLDLFLLGQDPEARQKIQTGVTEATSGIESGVTKQQIEADKARQSLQNLAAKYKTGGEFDLGAKLAATEAATKAATDSRLAGFTPDYQQKQLASVIGTEPTYGVDTASYIKNLAATSENIRSGEEAARLNALAQLAGQSGGYKAGDYEQQLQQAISGASSEIARQKGLYESEVGELSGASWQQPSAALSELGSNLKGMSPDQIIDNVMGNTGAVSQLWKGQNVKWELIPAYLKKVGAEAQLKRKYGLPVGDLSKYEQLANKYRKDTGGVIDIAGL